jgi:hypothetical protein
VGTLASKILSAVGACGTDTHWLDVFVAATMAGLGLIGGWQIVYQTSGELHNERTPLRAFAAE